MAENEIKLNFSGLERVRRLLQDTNTKYVKVGVLGSTNNRSKGGSTNAEIGFIQEFGRMEKPKIPARSFLRMPLREHLKDEIEKSKAFKEDEIDKAVAAGNGEQLVKKLGLVAEKVILEAFETSGWGKWKKNAPFTVKMKGSNKPLIDTGELRKSITSQVVKK